MPGVMYPLQGSADPLSRPEAKTGQKTQLCLPPHDYPFRGERSRAKAVRGRGCGGPWSPALGRGRLEESSWDPPPPQVAREDGLAWDMTVTHRIATTLTRENHVKATAKLWGPLELHLVLTGKQQSGEQGCLWGSACP